MNEIKTLAPKSFDTKAAFHKPKAELIAPREDFAGLIKEKRQVRFETPTQKPEDVPKPGPISISEIIALVIPPNPVPEPIRWGTIIQNIIILSFLSGILIVAAHAWIPAVAVFAGFKVVPLVAGLLKAIPLLYTGLRLGQRIRYDRQHSSS